MDSKVSTNGKGSGNRTTDFKKYRERFPLPCHHRFVDGVCIKCSKSLGAVFVEETEKDQKGLEC